MKSIFITAILVVALLAGGCSAVDSKPPDETSEIPEPSEIIGVPEPHEVSAPQRLPDTSDRISGTDATPPDSSKTDEMNLKVTGDAYSGIEIDAFIRERKSILPGFPIPVTVTIRNIGTETVDYVHGSGGYYTPEAISITADGLQPVLPKDHLGMVTMDFQVRELKPGDELQFEMTLMAIEPNENFNEHTVELYMNDEQYIAEKEWSELKVEFPELVPAEPGLYTGCANFLYYLRDSSGIPDLTEEASGYAQCDFQIAVV